MERGEEETTAGRHNAFPIAENFRPEGVPPSQACPRLLGNEECPH